MHMGKSSELWCPGMVLLPVCCVALLELGCWLLDLLRRAGAALYRLQWWIHTKVIATASSPPQVLGCSVMRKVA